MADKDKELQELEQQAGMTRTIKLKKPVNGKNTIELDFSKVTGRALLGIEKALRRSDPLITSANLTQEYQARVAALAADMKIDDIFDLNAADFNKVTTAAQVFLFA